MNSPLTYAFLYIHIHPHTDQVQHLIPTASFSTTHLPTHPGLDSVMGELVTNLLSALASGKTGGPRRVIMCVIHTPSSRMWGHFSHVLLLATGGYMAYHG